MVALVNVPFCIVFEMQMVLQLIQSFLIFKYKSSSFAPARAMSLSLGFLCHAEKKKFGLNLSEGNDSIVEGNNVFLILEIQPLLGFHYFSWHGTLAWKSRKNDVRLIEHHFCINPKLFETIPKIIHPRWGCMAARNIFW